MSAYDYNGTVLGAIYGRSGTSLGTGYAVDGTPLTPSPLPANPFLSTAIVTALPSISVSGTKQGACSDGVYIYQFCIPTFKGIKYKIADGTYTTVSLGSSVPYNHANDMAYNPNTGHIYVASMSSDGAVMELDTDFNYVATYYLTDGDGNGFPCWGLCFDRKTNHFLAERGNTTMMVYDQSFNFLGSFSMPQHPSATGQGCETDGDYIYRVTSSPNKIDVATINGEYVTTISNPMTGEPETLMYDWTNDRYFMSKNTSTDVFYGVQLKQQ